MNISSSPSKKGPVCPVHMLASCEANILDDTALAHESRLLNEALNVAWNTPDVRQDRIDAIRAQIEAGTYEIDSQKIAESLLRENPALFDEIGE